MLYPRAGIPPCFTQSHKKDKIYPMKILGVEIDKVTAKFIIVGIINTLFGTAIMFGCYNLLGLSYWVSSAANYFFGSILSFFLNKYFTFKSQSKSPKELLRFVINILICYLLAYGVAKPVAIRLLGGYSISIQENVAMVIGMVIFVGLNYIGQRYFVFVDKESKGEN